MSTAASQKGTIMEVSDADRRKEWSTSQSGMTQTVGTDADTIGVPRSVLAAACYIIRNSEHAESETAKAMRKYALSTQAAELDALRGEVERAWPDIGPDPLKGPREPGALEKAINRVEQAYVIQQKEVPDQTALVWRWDIGRLLMDWKRLRAWEKCQRDAEATIAQLRDRVAGLEEGLDWYGKTFCELGSSHECCGRLQTDDCSGCKARALLTQNEVG